MNPIGPDKANRQLAIPSRRPILQPASDLRRRHAVLSAGGAAAVPVSALLIAYGLRVIPRLWAGYRRAGTGKVTSRERGRPESASPSGDRTLSVEIDDVAGEMVSYVFRRVITRHGSTTEYTGFHRVWYRPRR